MMRHVRSGKNTRCIFFHLAPKVWEIGDPKRLTRVREPNVVVINQSWLAVGRGMTDRQTEWNDNKAHSLQT